MKTKLLLALSLSIISFNSFSVDFKQCPKNYTLVMYGENKEIDVVEKLCRPNDLNKRWWFETKSSGDIEMSGTHTTSVTPIKAVKNKDTLLGYDVTIGGVVFGVRAGYKQNEEKPVVAFFGNHNNDFPLDNETFYIKKD